MGLLRSQGREEAPLEVVIHHLNLLLQLVASREGAFSREVLVCQAEGQSVQGARDCEDSVGNSMVWSCKCGMEPLILGLNHV